MKQAKQTGHAPHDRDLAERYDEIIYGPVHLEYFDHSDFMNYGYWETGTQTQKEASENLAEKLLSFIPEKFGTILDVACGKGATTRHLLRYYAPRNVTGINISERQLETAKENAPGCTFFVMNATALAFPDASFDAVICVEAAFHFDTREQFFRKAHRVLKPGGHLVLSDILMNREAERRRKYRTEKNYVKGLGEYGQVMRRSGFCDVEVMDATVPCWKGHFDHAVRYFHEKFLLREIGQVEMESFLELSYNRVPDTEYYLLAHARKG